MDILKKLFHKHDWHYSSINTEEAEKLPIYIGCSKYGYLKRLCSVCHKKQYLLFEHFPFCRVAFRKLKGTGLDRDGYAKYLTDHKVYFVKEVNNEQASIHK